MTTLRWRPLRKLCLTLAAFAVLIAPPSVHAQQHSNPATYTSPSGQYELLVDHSEMEGGGPATYRLTRGGTEVWSDTRPFSIWDAMITDGGTVAGYAYRGGVHVGGNHGTRYGGLTIVILAPDGRELLRDPVSSHEARVIRNSWSGSDSPRVSGILVDPASDRFVVRVPLARVQDGDPTAWWTYQLSTGQPIGDIIPEHPGPTGTGRYKGFGFQRDLFAEIVPATPLTLVHWYTSGHVEEKRTQGAALSLLDSDGEHIWKLDLPGEYDALGDKWSWYWDLVEPGIQQASVGSHSFEFQSFSLATRLTFTVEPDEDSESGWRVTETARVDDRLPVGREAVSRPVVEVVELEQVGATELGTPATSGTSPITGVFDFAIDGAGNLGFINWGGSGPIKFMLVDSAGEVLSNFPLDLPQDDEAALPRVTPVAEGRWILVRQSYAEGVGTKAWWLDAATGELESVAGFTTGSIASLVPTGDGGFVTLAKHFLEYTIQDELNRYDSEGQPLWNQLEPGYGRGFSFQAATWIEGVGIAALVGTANTIEFVDVERQHLRSIDLAEVLGGEPNYPSGLTADLNSGLILHDFNGSPPIYRIDAEGNVIAKFHPRFPDGRTFRLTGDVQVAPDGTLWTSDQHSLLRLDHDGVVQQVIGPQPDSDALESVLAMTVDQHGNIYAINERSSAVHVFDSEGALLRICKPLPTDFSTDAGLGSITVSGDGSVYFDNGSYQRPVGNHGYLGFSADCERLGFGHLGLDTITETWIFKPGSRNRWVLGYEKIHLVNEDGDVAKTIDRRPDGDWLQKVQNGAVAPDGSLAVISMPTGFGTRGPHSLNIYGPNGDPLQTIPLASEYGLGSVAFNGSTVVVSTGKWLDLYDLDTGGIRRFTPPSDRGESEYWFPLFSPDGTELWLHPSRSTRILRYALP